MSTPRQIVFRITSAAGIQLRIVQRLKQIGIITTKRILKEGTDDNRYLILEVTGSNPPYDDIWNQVSEIPGILELVRGAIDESESKSPEPNKSEPAAQIEPEAGDADIRDRMLIFSLLSRYPRLDGRFNEIISAIPAENQQERALQLGRGFGHYLARQVNPKQPIDSLKSAMNHLLIPAISPMADIKLEGSALQITKSKIDLKGVGHKSINCDFLSGAITGLLSAYNMSDLLTENRCCTEIGGDICHFIFNE